MEYLWAALRWIFTGANWVGQDSIALRVGEHAWYTVLAVAAAALIAVPLGYFVGHTGRGATWLISVAAATRALPLLGVLTLVALLFGIGLVGPLTALSILAIPPILLGAFSGVDSVDPDTVDAAYAIGFTRWQVLVHIQIPLGMPLLLSGVRAATGQVVATATLAAYVGAGGLGRFLFRGLRSSDYLMMVAAAILIITVALLFEAFFEIVEKIYARIVRVESR